MLPWGGCWKIREVIPASNCRAFPFPLNEQEVLVREIGPADERSIKYGYGGGENMESQAWLAWLAGWEGLWSPRCCFMEFYGTRLLETKTLALSARDAWRDKQDRAEQMGQLLFPLLNFARITM